MKLEISKSVTKNNKSDQTARKTINTKVGRQEFDKYLTTVTIQVKKVTDKIGKSFEVHTLEEKMFNIKKSDFTARNENLKDEKNILQDKETTNSYRIKCDEFLEDINFDNGDLEEKDIHNKKESI